MPPVARSQTLVPGVFAAVRQGVTDGRSFFNYYRLTGENIAFGPESAEEVVAGWLGSPGHCANIMDARFRDTGIAVATGRKRGHIYWVQEFGLPAR